MKGPRWISLNWMIVVPFRRELSPLMGIVTCCSLSRLAPILPNTIRHNPATTASTSLTPVHRPVLPQTRDRRKSTMSATKKENADSTRTPRQKLLVSDSQWGSLPTSKRPTMMLVVPRNRIRNNAIVRGSLSASATPLRPFSGKGLASSIRSENRRQGRRQQSSECLDEVALPSLYQSLLG